MGPIPDVIVNVSSASHKFTCYRQVQGVLFGILRLLMTALIHGLIEGLSLYLRKEFQHKGI